MASFKFIFRLFKQTIQNLQLISVKICPSCDSNSQPSHFESPPLTTKPGFSPSSERLSVYELPRDISLETLSRFKPSEYFQSTKT